MALYDVPAPAKLNLFLHVTGRRPDGYHTLQTVFRFIDLQDSLDFDLRLDGRIVREGDTIPGLDPDQDLVVRAAVALQRATGTPLGAQIRYTKRIPSGAGLGGGSSDAASTLIALNRLWKTGLDRHALMKLGGTLGADVPVFIFGRPAFAEGVGDQLSDVELPENAYLVLRPLGGVSTAQVFSDPDLTRDTKPVIISVFARWQTDRAHTQSQAKYGLPLFGRNDLEPVVLARHNNVRAIADNLRKQGFHARMTGSGNCFFVEYETIEQATEAQRKISSKMLGSRNERQAGHSEVTAETATEFHEGDGAVVENTWACPGLFEHPLRYW